ncbi:MAG: hypothetical protein ACFB10_20115 [Salibacteraceae bacterium]
MSRKILYLALVCIFFLSTGINCCGDQDQICFQPSGLAVDFVTREDGVWAELPGDVVSLDSYALQFNIERQRETQAYRYYWGQAAYALTCDVVETWGETFTDLQVFTLRDIAADVPAGSDISERVTISEKWVTEVTENTVEEVLARLNDPNLGYAPVEFIVHLNSDTVSDSLLQFVVALSTDTQVFRDTTAAIAWQ